MYKFLLILILLLSIGMSSISAPLYFSLSLVVVALLASVFTMKMGMNWIFMAVSIMFLGGMMVVFIYASSVSVNKKLVSFITKNLFLWMGLALFLANLSPEKVSIYSQASPLSMYSSVTAGPLAFMALYLIVTLLALVKLVRWNDGPLKPVC